MSVTTVTHVAITWHDEGYYEGQILCRDGKKSEKFRSRLSGIRELLALAERENVTIPDCERIGRQLADPRLPDELPDGSEEHLADEVWDEIETLLRMFPMRQSDLS